MTNDDRAKLRTLLTYWIEHNEEHVEEFQERAEKAKALGKCHLIRGWRIRLVILLLVGDLRCLMKSYCIT